MSSNINNVKLQNSRSDKAVASSTLPESGVAFVEPSKLLLGQVVPQRMSLDGANQGCMHVPGGDNVEVTAAHTTSAVCGGVLSEIEVHRDSKPGVSARDICFDIPLTARVADELARAGGQKEDIYLKFKLPSLMTPQHILWQKQVIYHELFQFDKLRTRKEQWMRFGIDDLLPVGFFKGSCWMYRFGLEKDPKGIIPEMEPIPKLTMREIGKFINKPFECLEFPRKSTAVDLVKWCLRCSFSGNDLKGVDRRDLNAPFVECIRFAFWKNRWTVRYIADRLMSIPITVEHPMTHPWTSRVMREFTDRRIAVGGRAGGEAWLGPFGHQSSVAIPWIPGMTRRAELLPDIEKKVCETPATTNFTIKQVEAKCQKMKVDDKIVWCPYGIIAAARLIAGWGRSYEDCVTNLTNTLRAKRDVLLPTTELWPDWNFIELPNAVMTAVWSNQILDPRVAWRAWTSDNPAAEGWYAVPQKSARGPVPDINILSELHVSIRDTPTNKYLCRCLAPEIPIIRGIPIYPLFICERTEDSIIQAVCKRIARKRCKTNPATAEEKEEFIRWFAANFRTTAPIDVGDLRAMCLKRGMVKIKDPKELADFMEGVDMCLSGSPPPSEWGASYTIFIKREDRKSVV